MDLSLDGLYRAVLRGLQVGLGSALTLVIVKTAITLPGLQKISPLAVFFTGILLGIAFAFYRDYLKVRTCHKYLFKNRDKTVVWVQFVACNAGHCLDI